MPFPRIPLRTNLLLLLLAMRLWLVELVAVPLAMAWLHPAYGLLLLAALLLIPLRWQLLHEAAHGRLLPSRRYNRLAGRLLAISLGLPFAVWCQAHQLHHRYSRTELCRVEVYEPGVEHVCRRQLLLCLRLCGGAYLLAWTGSLLLLCYPSAARWGWLARRVPLWPRLCRRMQASGQLQLARMDALLACLLPGLSLLVYGQHHWMLWLALGLRAMLISLTDHVCFAGQPLGCARQAANLVLPRWLGLCVLNSHLRGVHQRWPQLGWQALPQHFSAAGLCWDGGFVRQMCAGQWRVLPTTSLPVIPLRKAGMGIMPADFHYPRLASRYRHDPAQE
ncbi:fatty acid desaturase [Aquitalea sp.]|uniref:fatty acid desaturase n=1 Tax=Aquitalea sp. TaxID=1872623 RepID=UPI00258D3067|nr:fatty acid desaturase [Aquitalea sp.]